jgi:GNAT superfamily N-acetyltransferase
VDFRIHRAGEGDVPNVVLLARQLYSEIQHEVAEQNVAATARALVAEEGSCALLAVRPDGTEALGLLTLAECTAMYAGGRFGSIQEFYVAPASRKQGAGHLLLAEARRFGASRAWTRLEVTATAEHVLAESAAYYRRNGFEESGPRLKLTLH